MQKPEQSLGIELILFVFGVPSLPSSHFRLFQMCQAFFALVDSAS